MSDYADTEHVDYPHWPGTLHDCPACKAQMAEDEETAYDEQEHVR